jgi:sortase A
MKSRVRKAGTFLLVAGVLVLAWVVVVWRWQDPFTALYTTWKQHQLADDYSRRVAKFHHPTVQPGASLAVMRREVAIEARRYRATSKRGEAIGRIKIPRLGLNMILVNGTDHDSLMKGPGRDLRTYMPGQGELVYIAGHRTTYLAPFSDIESFRRGDSVTLEMPYATFQYRVTTHKIVSATDLSQLKSHHREILALQACHPRFFASQRYIVYAVPVRVELRGGPAFSVSSEKLAAPARAYASRR